MKLPRLLLPISILATCAGCFLNDKPMPTEPLPNDEVKADTAKLHEVVATGSLEDLQEALDRGWDPNASGRIGQTALMAAIEAKSLDKVKLLIDRGADPELTDDFNDTPLAYAVCLDWPSGVRYLLSLGVDRGYAPKHPLKKVDLDVSSLPSDMPESLRGVISAEEWEASLLETRNSIQELGENPSVEPVVARVQSVGVLKLLIQAGDDLNLAPEDIKRELVGLTGEASFQSSRSEYQDNKSPRFGRSNPEQVENPFWQDMVRLGVNAYEAKQHFKEEDTLDGPVWCFDRFGDTITPLADGRFVQIAGEHEDFYDPDFCIYNDVVVHDGQGGFTIFGYPEDVFPPTDFHTATLVGEWVYLIGSLGYPGERRVGETPVYRLRLDEWRIQRVDASGEPPGWLHKHRALYDADRNAIRVSGGELCQLNTDGEQDLVGDQQEFWLDLDAKCWQMVATD